MTDASTHAMIVAQYTDCRAYRGLGVIRITCELPVEYEAVVHRLIGYPPKAVIISVASEDAVKAFGDQLKQAKEPPKEKRRFEDMKPSQQAGILCQDAVFWEFLAFYTGGVEASEDGAAQCVRDICNVGSRSALDADPEGKATWRGIVKRFHDWKSTDKRYAGTPAMERG